MRDEAERLRHAVAQRAVADDHAAAGRRAASTSSRIPFSSREPARRRGRAAARPARRPSSGIVDAARDHAHVARAELGAPRRRGADDAQIDEPRARARPGARATGPAARARRRSPTPGATNGFPVASAASADGIQCAWTRSASRAARRAARAYAARKSGSERREPRPRAQVLDDARRRRRSRSGGSRPARRPRPRRRARRSRSTASATNTPGDVVRASADTTSSGRATFTPAAPAREDERRRQREGHEGVEVVELIVR